MNSKLEKNRHFRNAKNVVVFSRTCGGCANVRVPASGQLCFKCREVVARRLARVEQLKDLKLLAASAAIAMAITLGFAFTMIYLL